MRYVVASGGTLAVLTVFAFSFNPTFDLGSSSSATNVESAEATKTLEDGGFSAGATQPTPIVLHSSGDLTQDEVDQFAAGLKDVDGIGQVLGDTGTISPTDPSTAIVMTVLDEDPSSDAALAAVRDTIRPAAHDLAPEGTTAYVGGITSVFVDFQAAMNRDYTVVFPVAALIIMLILALLLRSLVAPLYLMVSVGLGFGATLGASVIVFQHVQGHNGLIFLLPIYIYLFVVALGTDYNILMIARLREESREGKSPRDAAAEAVQHAGPTVAAAGLILAGTFASLMLAGNSLLVSMGFAISFGIAVSAFVMAMFFTPVADGAARARRLVARPRGREGPGGAAASRSRRTRRRRSEGVVPDGTGSLGPVSHQFVRDYPATRLTPGRSSPAGEESAGRSRRGRRTPAGDHLGAERGDHRAVVGAQAGARDPHPDAGGGGALLGHRAQP